MLDRFFQWFDRLTQNAALKSFMSTFYWIDYVAFLFAVAGLIYGMKAGMMAELGEILQLSIVIFLTLAYFRKVVFFLANYFPSLPHVSVAPVSFILTAVAVWFVASFIFGLLKKVMHANVSAPVRILGGALLGIFHLLLILSFMCQALLLMPTKHTKKMFEQGTSYTGYYLSNMAPQIYKIFREPMKFLIPIADENGEPDDQRG